MEYIIKAATDKGTLYLARRQSLDKALLSDSITQTAKYAQRWSDSEFVSYNLADAETFRAHAEQHAPLGWAITEA